MLFITDGDARIERTIRFLTNDLDALACGCAPARQFGDFGGRQANASHVRIDQPDMQRATVDLRAASPTMPGVRPCSGSSSLLPPHFTAARRRMTVRDRLLAGFRWLQHHRF